MAAVGQLVEERGGHHCIAEHGGRFAETQVCGDDYAGAFIKLA